MNMNPSSATPILLALTLIASGMPLRAQVPRQKAWGILQSEVKNKNPARRAQAVRVLGLLPGDPEAVRLAEKALEDGRFEVRTAAATSLGQMGSKASIPKLKKALGDKEAPVVLASAHALRNLGDNSAYEVFYAVLTGKRKTGEDLLAKQERMLRDPKKMAQFGFEQGIGFVPFAGMGWFMVKAMAKDDVSPVRAAAAEVLAEDPDPASGEALVKAAFDKSWIVRAAALHAIAKRGDPNLMDSIVPAMADGNQAVRCTAAAAVIRLSPPAKPVTDRKQQ
jgi:HEAT repeat protein